MNLTLNIDIIFKRMLLCVLLISACSGCSTYFFYPSKSMPNLPSKAGIDYEDIHLHSKDGTPLHAWLLKAKNAKGIVYYLHGNAQNISMQISNVYWLPQRGYDVLLLDYRGYGLSQGQPDFPEVYDDVDAGYRWLQQYVEKNNRRAFVLGQSLGAAISSYYFSQLPPNQIVFDGVILDSVFSGHRAIAKDVFSRHWITWPWQWVVTWFVPKAYDPLDHIVNFSPTPLLFFHSPDDAILPYQQGREVYENAGEPKHWITTKGRHTATFDYTEYRNTLIRFMENPRVNPNGL